MEWLAALGIAAVGYGAAALAAGLSLSMERQPEASAALFGALRLAGLVIAALAACFATVTVGYAAVSWL